MVRLSRKSSRNKQNHMRSERPCYTEPDFQARRKRLLGMGYRATKMNKYIRQDVKTTNRIGAQEECDKLRGLYLES